MRVAVLLACLACGCSQKTEPMHMDILCECYATAAYEAYRAELLRAVPDEPQKCCGQCGKNGLPPGKMLSGDRLSVVPCPCPDTCKCKAKSCVSGTCRKQQ